MRLSRSQQLYRSSRTISREYGQELSEPLNPLTSCETCGPEHLRTITGSVYCTMCGSFLGEQVETRPRASYGDQHREDPSHMTSVAHFLFPESELCSRVSRKTGTVTRSYTEFSVSAEKSGKRRCDELVRICQSNHIPKSLTDLAQTNYINIIRTLQKLSLGVPRSDRNKGLMAGALHYAMIELEVPRDEKELARIFQIDRTYVSHGKKVAHQMLTRQTTPTEKYTPRVIQSQDFVNRFCNHLQLPPHLKAEVSRILARAEALGLLVNNQPDTAVAGCIRMVCELHNHPLTISQISSKCNSISVATINKIKEKLFENLATLFMESRPSTTHSSTLSPTRPSSLHPAPRTRLSPATSAAASLPLMLPSQISPPQIPPPQIPPSQISPSQISPSQIPSLLPFLSEKSVMVVSPPPPPLILPPAKHDVLVPPTKHDAHVPDAPVPAVSETPDA